MTRPNEASCQTERLLQPVTDALLHRGRRRRARRVERHLVPAGRENVGAGRGVQRATDHKTEVPGAHRCHESRLDRRGEPLDYRGGVRPLLGQRPTEGGPQRRRVDERRDGPIPRAHPIVGGAVRGQAKKLSKLRHRNILPPISSGAAGSRSRNGPRTQRGGARCGEPRLCRRIRAHERRRPLSGHVPSGVMQLLVPVAPAALGCHVEQVPNRLQGADVTGVLIAVRRRVEEL